MYSDPRSPYPDGPDSGYAKGMGPQDRDPYLSDDQAIQRMMQEQMLRRFRFEQRRGIVLRVAVAVGTSVAGAAVCLHVFGPDAIASFLEEVWPVLISPVAGWLLGMWAVRILYKPSGRVVVCMEPDTHLFRAVFIPDTMFRYFVQSGNNVLYHSAQGVPVYIAERIDTGTGEIRYSWIHELSSLEVMTREDTYNNWRDILEDVLRENLGLMDHPHVIGIGYARRCLREQLDSIAEALGLTGRDFSRDRSVSEPREQASKDPEDNLPSDDPEDQGGEAVERGHRVHQRDGARPDHSRRLGEAGEVLQRPLPDSVLLAGPPGVPP